MCFSVNKALLPQSFHMPHWEAPSEVCFALSLLHTNWPGSLEVRWGGRRWRRQCMAVICDWGHWKSLMWEPLVHSVSRSMEAHAGCAAWTNKALCVLEWIPLLPYYQFEVWFAGDDINDKQSALVSSSGMETAALNFNNFSIHSLWM